MKTTRTKLLEQKLRRIIREEIRRIKETTKTNLDDIWDEITDWASSGPPTPGGYLNTQQSREIKKIISKLDPKTRSELWLYVKTKFGPPEKFIQSSIEPDQLESPQLGEGWFAGIAEEMEKMLTGKITYYTENKFNWDLIDDTDLEGRYDDGDDW